MHSRHLVIGTIMGLGRTVPASCAKGNEDFFIWRACVYVGGHRASTSLPTCLGSPI